MCKAKTSETAQVNSETVVGGKLFLHTEEQISNVDNQATLPTR